MNFKDLLDILSKRWWIIAIVTLMLTSITALVNYFVLKDVYSASTKLYIGREETKKSTEYNELMLNAQLIKDCRELVKSRLVPELAMKKLNDRGISVHDFSSQVDVSVIGETRFIQISAEDNDPKLAMEIANATAEVLRIQAQEKLFLENMMIIDKAEQPTKPVKPRKELNTIFAFFLGLAIGIGLVILVEYFDNTIKTPDEVEKLLGIPTIGTIPLFEELA